MLDKEKIFKFVKYENRSIEFALEKCGDFSRMRGWKAFHLFTDEFLFLIENSHFDIKEPKHERI